MRARQAGLFIAGIAAWESVVHMALAACDMLPLHWCGITITAGLNAFQMVSSGLVSLALTYLCAIRKSGKTV